MPSFFTQINIQTPNNTLKTLWIRETLNKHPGVRWGLYSQVSELHHTYYKTGHRHTESQGKILRSSQDIPFSDIDSFSQLVNHILPIHPSITNPISGKLLKNESRVSPDRTLLINIIDYTEAVCVNYYLVNKSHKIDFIRTQLDQVQTIQTHVSRYELVLLEFISLKYFSNLELAVVILDQSINTDAYF